MVSFAGYFSAITSYKQPIRQLLSEKEEENEIGKDELLPCSYSLFLFIVFRHE